MCFFGLGYFAFLHVPSVLFLPPDVSAATGAGQARISRPGGALLRIAIYAYGHRRTRWRVIQWYTAATLEPCTVLSLVVPMQGGVGCVGGGGGGPGFRTRALFARAHTPALSELSPPRR